MPWVYMLRCADGSLYVGSTTDLAIRIDQHNSGRGSAYTRTRLPVELMWSQETERVDEAWALERKLHGWSRAKREAVAQWRITELGGYSVRQRRCMTPPS